MTRPRRPELGARHNRMSRSAVTTLTADDRRRAKAFRLDMADVIRTRFYVRDIQHCEPVAAVHGSYFGQVRPANSLVEVSALVGTYDVEIEAEAELSR